MILQRERAMTLKREWVTPVAAGTFLLSAVTGVLIFFHVDSGLNKAAHEWLSWALLAAVALHGAVNFTALKMHLGSRRGQALVGLFLLVLALSFVPAGKGGEPPFLAPMRALAGAPLATVAEVARTTPEDLRRRLAAAGYAASSDRQSVAELVGPDPRQQTRVLGTIMGPSR